MHTRLRGIQKGMVTIGLSGFLLGLTACGGSSGGGDDVVAPGGGNFSLFVANDQGTANASTVDQFSVSANLASGGTVSQTTYNLPLNEGIVLDRGSNLYQAGIEDGPTNGGTLATLCSTRASSATAGGMTVDFTSPQIDRIIATGVGAPKGIEIAWEAGLIITAENVDGDGIQVYSATAGPGADRLFSVNAATLGGNPWDVTYDADTDRLFAALTNGGIVFIDQFVALQGGGTRNTFTPTTALAASNMHGIDYDGATDRLAVSDVAVPSGGAFNTDGSLYSFMNASTLVGAVTPRRTIQGPLNTGLGNPVDLRLVGEDVVVAEKTNGGSLRVFRNVFDNSAMGVPEDVAPDRMIATAAGSPPESIALRDDTLGTTADFTDLNGETINFLFVASNPGTIDTDNVFRVDPGLITQQAMFDATTAGQDVENVALDQNGDAVISFDVPASSTGGLSFINRLALRMTGEAIDLPDTDRQILGAATTLVAPKGVETVSDQGAVLVADLNAAAPGAIKAFSLCASGNVAPVFTTTLPAGTRPWDVDYDPDADRLFVAATNGTVLVYDGYFAGTPGTATPDRIIDPADAFGGASNIHGIIHVAETDQLILSDVGAAGSSTDGRLYVLDNASTASGVTTLRLEIGGPATLLGNPVDIAFDGTNLYVAEKANGGGFVFRFDNILSLTGNLNIGADRSTVVVNPESVALSADFLPAP